MCARVKCCGIVDGCVHKHVCMQKYVHVRCTTLPASSFHVSATKCVSSASSKSSQHLPVSTSPWIVVPHTVCNNITLQCPLEKVSQEKFLSQLKAKNSVLPKQLICFYLTSTVNCMAYPDSHFAWVTRKLIPKHAAFSRQAYRSLCWAFLALLVIFILHLYFSTFKTRILIQQSGFYVSLKNIKYTDKVKC